MVRQGDGRFTTPVSVLRGIYGFDITVVRGVHRVGISFAAHVRNLGSSGGDLEYAGPIKRFFRKMHEPLHHSHGSSGGRSYGSSGGSSGGVVISEKQPIDAEVDRSEGEISGLQSGDYEATLEADSANEQQQEGDSSSAIEANSQSGTATLTIAVPEAASVVINGHETKSTGETRYFRSVNLDSEETLVPSCGFPVRVVLITEKRH